MRRTLFVLFQLLLLMTCFTGVSAQSIRISGDLELKKLSDNAYIHVSYTDLPGYGRTPANGLIFINGHDAFLFDTPWNDSLTGELVTYLKDKMGIRIRGFVPNHWHDDCMGGLNYLKSAGIPSWANEMTIEIAKEKKLPVPDMGFRDSLTLHLGDKAVCCYYPGAAHSLDNIVVWIPSEKVLFAGCMVKSLSSRNPGNTADGDLKAYPVTLGKLLKRYRDARIVIPGHGEAGGYELITHTMDLLKGVSRPQ